jgi:hypothetical protein
MAHHGELLAQIIIGRKQRHSTMDSRRIMSLMPASRSFVGARLTPP